MHTQRGDNSVYFAEIDVFQKYVSYIIAIPHIVHYRVISSNNGSVVEYHIAESFDYAHHCLLSPSHDN